MGDILKELSVFVGRHVYRKSYISVWQTLSQNFLKEGWEIQTAAMCPSRGTSHLQPRHRGAECSLAEGGRVGYTEIKELE